MCSISSWSILECLAISRRQCQYIPPWHMSLQQTEGERKAYSLAEMFLLPTVPDMVTTSVPACVRVCLVRPP